MIFFRLWFAFVAMLAISIIGLMIYAGVSIATNPDGAARELGNFVGSFIEAAKQPEEN